MKFLRFIFLFIFKLILFVGVLCLLLSFSFKTIIDESFSFVLTSSDDTVEMFQSIGIEKDKIEQFVDSAAVQELIIEYVNPVINGTVDLENINIGSDILNFIKQNQELIEEAIDKPLPMEDLEKYYSSENIEFINESYKELAISVQEDMSAETREVISIFSYLVSNEFRFVMITICVMSLLFIGLIQKSAYVWIRTLSNILICNGLLGGIIVGFGSFVITNMLSEMISGKSFDFNRGFTCSLMSVGSGVVGLIVYLIIKRSINKKKVTE